MRKLVILVIAILIPAGAAQAQTPPARPRIGLVLSGGGARGFAHLGVLKVLDELRVPVDAIAGTSMGAVVGGLFALGTPYPELERFFRSEDWTALFQDDPPRPELPMRRKRADLAMPLDFEVGVAIDGVHLPPALVTGSKLNNALWAYTYRPSPVERFDDLPIPFRAVATDVENGEMVVLDHGDLAAAIRSSMAVPAAFSPLEVEGRRLVDGGLVRNIPIDVAREMGVDILIVSDVGTSLEDAPPGDDPLSLTLRLITVITWGSSKAQVETLTDRDVQIRPALGGLSAADFSQLDATLAAGETAARAAAGRLAGLSIPEAEYRALVEARAARLPAVAEFTPSEVRVDASATSLSPDVIQAILDIEAGASLTLDELRRRLTRLHGYGGFEAADFRIVDEASGPGVLEVRPRDKSWGPLLMRAGLSLVDRQKGAGRWSLRSRLEWTRMTSRGGEAWVEAEMGTRHGLRGSAHLPLTASEGWFLTAYGTLGRREIAPDLLDLRLEAELTDRLAAFGLGRRIGSWGELTAAVGLGQYDFELPNEVDGERPRVRFDERSFEFGLEGDVLDRVNFPASGHRLTIRFARGGTWLGGTGRFDHLLADGQLAVSAGHQTVTLSALFSSGLGTEVPYHRSPTLGGFDLLAGAPRDAFRGGYSGFLKLGWSYRLGARAKDPQATGLRLGFSLEGGQAWTLPDEVQLRIDAVRFGGSVWAGVATPLGPVRFGYAKINGERAGWVVQVGVAY